MSLCDKTSKKKKKNPNPKVSDQIESQAIAELGPAQPQLVLTYCHNTILLLYILLTVQ